MRRCLLAASGLHRSRCIKCPSAPTIIEPSMHAVSEKSRLLIVTEVIRNFPSRGVIPNSILTNSLFLLRASSGNPNAALDCL